MATHPHGAQAVPPRPSTPPAASEGGIWGVQHLLHPAMPHRQTFARLYFGDAVLDVVQELLGLSPGRDADGQLVMELLNLLVSPSGGRDFELGWHRDDVRPDVSAAEEARQLERKSPGGRQSHAQYNIALYDDASLVVVPGSHRRVRTPAERAASPYAANLPGQVTVALGPGDALFYDSNILHRGVYRGVAEDVVDRGGGRLTLHGSVGLGGHGGERARQVLQHGVGDWVHRLDFSSSSSSGLGEVVGRRAEGMRRRLVDMGRDSAAGDVGYSLEG